MKCINLKYTHHSMNFDKCTSLQVKQTLSRYRILLSPQKMSPSSVTAPRGNHCSASYVRD